MIDVDAHPPAVSPLPVQRSIPASAYPVRCVSLTESGLLHIPGRGAPSLRVEPAGPGLFIDRLDLYLPRVCDRMVRLHAGPEPVELRGTRYCPGRVGGRRLYLGSPAVMIDARRFIVLRDEGTHWIEVCRGEHPAAIGLAGAPVEDEVEMAL